MTPAGDARFVDLHAHSTESDGSIAPEALADVARAAGLSAVALTDHDTVGGVAAAQAAGERIGVRVIAGVELSAMDGDQETHLLGLHLSRTEPLEAELRVFRDTRISRAQEMVRRLNTLGVPVTMEQVLVEAGTGAIGRPHVAHAVIAGGWARDSKEVFDRYLGNGRPANVPKHALTLTAGIKLVHDAGGLAILAHPGADGRRARLEPLVALGLDGIEVRHPSHTSDDIARLGALTDFFGLVPSGGSDWHGATEGVRTLGNMRVPYEWLARQDARVAARARERVA